MVGIAFMSAFHSEPTACATELAEITNCKLSQSLLWPILACRPGPNEPLECRHIPFLFLPCLQMGEIGVHLGMQFKTSSLYHGTWHNHKLQASTQTLLWLILAYRHGSNDALEHCHTPFLPLTSPQQLWGVMGGLFLPQRAIKILQLVLQNRQKSPISSKHIHYSGPYWLILKANWMYGCI